MTDSAPRVAVFIPSFGDGGVERMMVNIARGLSACGAEVDFISGDGDGPYLDTLPPQVRRLSIGIDARAGLSEYLREQPPAALISAKRDDDALALECRRRSGAPTRLYARVGTTFSAHRSSRRPNPLKYWWQARKLRGLYRQMDGILCVSEGVAEDLQRITGLPRALMQVLPNPVVTPELLERAAEAVEHPWLGVGQPPVILGAGRLGSVKNFPLLLRAFARVRAQRDCRLMIIGEGRKRDDLQALAQRLGVESDVCLPGFAQNAYAYMARASVFVLSSNVEGSPNVLVEALAVGTPVVATDCPSGPREILEHGRHGALVPVGDEAALATAIAAALDRPPAAETLRAAAQRYTLISSARAYLRAIGLNPEAMNPRP